MYTISPFIRSFAFALLAGSVLASVWVNLAPESYFDMVEFRLVDLPLPVWVLPTAPSLTPLSLVSDLLMPAFFFFLGKELWEALVLERGALSFRSHPGLMLGSFAGASVGAVAAWLIATALVDPSGEAGLRAGWATGIGSDVMLCYLIGLAVFGRGHPALHFLLLLTVVQDIAALCLTAVSLPFEGHHLLWATGSPLAALMVWILYGRHYHRRDASEVTHRRADSLLPYVLAGAVSWVCFLMAGFPPELGLLPIIPAIPHASRSFGIFAEAEGLLQDPLNRLVSALTPAITVILFLFGLTRGGIEIEALGPGTEAVLSALWIGKPIGLLAGASLALTFGGGRLPQGMRLSDLVLLALITATGFVAPVTVLDLSLAGGLSAAEARLGLALSLLAGPLTLLAALAIRRGRRR